MTRLFMLTVIAIATYAAPAHAGSFHVKNFGFEVDAFSEMRLDRFSFKHLQIEAVTAGHIFDATDGMFSDVSLKTEDGSVVSLSDDSHIKRIAFRVATPNQIKLDPNSKSFVEQDKN